MLEPQPHGPTIREPDAKEMDHLLDLWERSVRATHLFLTEEDISELRPLVRQGLEASPELWAIYLSPEAGAAGFMALDECEGKPKLEALFIDPDLSRRGLGTVMVDFARQRKGVLDLDVNEQNPGAHAFYLRQGFTETGRSPVDTAGRPFPLIHMRG